MSRLPLVAFGSDVLVRAARAGDPRRIAAAEPLRTAAGGGAFLLPGRAAARHGRGVGRAAAISEKTAEGAALGAIRVVAAFAADGGVHPAARAALL